MYFHRNENGGCVLFNSLGSPWPIHDCWEQYKNEHSGAIQGLIEKRINQLKTICIKKFQFIEEIISTGTSLEGFILGYDKERRILPDPARRADAASYLRYMVFKTIDGEHIKILVPEKNIEEIVKYSYATIQIEHHKKSKRTLVFCLREIGTNAIDSSERSQLRIIYDYKHIMSIP